VCVVEAPPENLKVTRPLDLELAEALLRARGERAGPPGASPLKAGSSPPERLP
jgi:hypothetical protein